MKKPLPPTYLVVSLILVVALHFLLPVFKFIFLPWNLWGILPLLLGIYLNLAADRAFKQMGTTVKPYETSSALITDGVFRISRHPMYLGMVLILFGLSVLLGSLTPFLVTVVFAVIMARVFIPVEENMMQETFGEQYREYTQKVRKWV